MQILAEGTAQAIFRFLADAKILPVPDRRHPDYESRRLDLLFRERDGHPTRTARAVARVIEWGAAVLPS